jgi:hypothetical protein
MEYLPELSEAYTLPTAKNVGTFEWIFSDLAHADTLSRLNSFQDFLFETQEALGIMTTHLYRTLPSTALTARMRSSAQHLKAVLGNPDTFHMTKAIFDVVQSSLETLQESVKSTAGASTTVASSQLLESAEAKITSAYTAVAHATAGLIAGLQYPDISGDLTTLQAALELLSEAGRDAISSHITTTVTISAVSATLCSSSSRMSGSPHLL